MTRNPIFFGRYLLVLGLAHFATSNAQDSRANIANAVRAHVEYLADDLLEGRGTASRGHALAAAYVASQFRQLGLEPFGDPLAAENNSRITQRSFFQSVRLLEATPVLPGSAAKYVNGNETIKFEYSSDYLPAANYANANSTLTAPLAFVGFGVTAPESKYDDYASVDVRDRIAIVLSGAPANFGHDRRAFYSWTGEKYRNLIERGAVGIVVVDPPSEANRVPWERRVKMSWDPQMRWLDGEDKPVDAHPELKERFRLNQAAFAKLLQSSGHSIDQVFATAELGQPQGFTLPGTLTLTSTTGLRRTESTNVVGVLKGSDPVLRSQYIVVTAHLDHLGRGAAVNGDAIYNGAHDNASGIAILLELARALAHSASPPKRSIIFVAVTGEEKGLVGSDYFAANAASNRVRMVANLNIDMPMIFGPTLDWIVLGAEHSTLGETATHAVQNHGYVTSRDRRPEEVLFIRSDQFSFIRRGIPSVYLGSGYRSRTRSVDVAALQQEFLRTHYHQPSDDLALPMYYAGAADLIQIESELLLETANQDDRPHWNRTSFFGKKFAR